MAAPPPGMRRTAEGPAPRGSGPHQGRPGNRSGRRLTQTIPESTSTLTMPDRETRPGAAFRRLESTDGEVRRHASEALHPHHHGNASHGMHHPLRDRTLASWPAPEGRNGHEGVRRHGTTSRGTGGAVDPVLGPGSGLPVLEFFTPISREPWRRTRRSKTWHGYLSTGCLRMTSSVSF